MKDGQVEVTVGPIVETKEKLGGILLLEARELNHAIALMSKHSGVTMGPVEIPLAGEKCRHFVRIARTVRAGDVTWLVLVHSAA